MDANKHISDYAFLSDCHTAALVRQGSVEWLCLPRFDSGSVFASILDSERAGSFSILPAGPFQLRRAYEPGTNVLVSTFSTAAGELEITDCLAIEPAMGDSASSDPRPLHALIRSAKCTSGSVAVDVICDPRPDYGRVVPGLILSDGRWLIGQGGHRLVLDSDAPLEKGEAPGLRADLTMRHGDTASFVLHFSGTVADEALPARIDAGRAINATLEFWRSWSSGLEYSGRYREQVLRSALVLKGLTCASTGAIIAAPTTSLPEWFGGQRNWDYRYCWLRDSTFTLYALEKLGCDADVHEYRRWLERAARAGPAGVHIAYTIDGDEVPPEQTLDQLRGFRGSRPVRIGNDAREQMQLDVYGELMDTAFFSIKHGAPMDPDYWTLLSGFADHVCDTWRRPDRGIWEMRTEPRQFVYSKVLCWVCLNRAIRIARASGLQANQRWRREMRAIKAEVLANGFNSSVGAFVQSYGSTALDAANLIMPVVGFIPARDPRMAATIRLTDQHLAKDGLVRRYQGVDDGLSGPEGAFLLGSFWLVDAMIMLGERGQARQRFEALLARCNDVGLLPEEFDEQTGEMLGNFPQAFSHLALITSALNLRHGRTNRRHMEHAGAGARANPGARK